MLEKCLLNTQVWITMVHPSILSSKNGTLYKKQQFSSQLNHTNGFAQSNLESVDTLYTSFSFYQVKRKCTQRLKWNKITNFYRFIKEIFKLKWHCFLIANAQQWRLQGLLLESATNAAWLHIKMPGLHIITFANVKNSEKVGGKLPVLVWKEFWLYRHPESTWKDTRNLQRVL